MDELIKLIVPPLANVVMDKSIIKAEIADSSNGIYSARLFVPADSPDNLDKQVSIGWVNLDVNAMRAYDVTNDPNNKIDLKVTIETCTKICKECISVTPKEDFNIAMCTALERTAEKKLPWL
jgi:hypothetical protein